MKLAPAGEEKYCNNEHALHEKEPRIVDEDPRQRGGQPRKSDDFIAERMGESALTQCQPRASAR